MGFFPWEIRVALSGESQLRQSRTTQPAGCFSVSIILEHIVNRFSDAAKNFSLTISLKKTEVLYQPSPRVAYSPPHIRIDGTKLNAVEHFTYLGSIISNDATVSKDLDNRLSKASSSFGILSK